MEEENNQKFIDIRPLSKWKRLLVFLGDYFISFIISFTLFNLLVFPLASFITNIKGESERAADLDKQALNMLKEDGYLFSANAYSTFIEDVNYTFKVFLSYYAFDEETPTVTTDEQYGHKLENEVVLHYYENVIKDTNQYVKDFKEVNEKNQMFTIGETVDSIVLKNDYKAILSNELLEVKDESKYSEAMINFRDQVFARLFYLHVYNHVKEHDYIKNGVSFNDLMKQEENIIKSINWVPTVSSFIAIILSWGVVYVAYPLINKENHTMTMSIMKVDKLHYKSLGPADRKRVMISSFYHLVEILSYSLFLPVLYYGLAYCFNLPLLIVLSLITLGLSIVSGLFIIFNEYNRSGSDIITETVLVPTSELDHLYMENLENGK